MGRCENRAGHAVLALTIDVTAFLKPSVTSEWLRSTFPVFYSFDIQFYFSDRIGGARVRKITLVGGVCRSLPLTSKSTARTRL